MLIGIVFATILVDRNDFYPKTSRKKFSVCQVLFFLFGVFSSFFVLLLSLSLALLSLLCLSGPELPVKPLKVFIPAQSINQSIFVII